jgi:acyl-CoA-binding protein
MSNLEQLFASACRRVSGGFIHSTPSQQLQLYALYKQATVGSMSTADEQAKSSCAGDVAKSTAWAALEGVTRDSACQQYVDVVSSIDAELHPDASSSDSADIHIAMHDHGSMTDESGMPSLILPLLCRCFPGSFDDETSVDSVRMQKQWLFSIYDPSDCAFAVVVDGSGLVVGFAAAAAFFGTRRMNVFNLVTLPNSTLSFIFDDQLLLFVLQCVDPTFRRRGVSKRIAGQCSCYLSWEFELQLRNVDPHKK